jgi:hypothetical protein
MDELQQWVTTYTTRPLANTPTVEVVGTKTEQDYVWARFEWLKLGANHAEAAEALQELNQLGDSIEDGLLDKKNYLLTVKKAFERMAKKHVCVSRQGDSLLCGVMDHVHSHNTFKLLTEQRSGNTVVEPMVEERYNLILLEMHEARLNELQAAHDSALYEVQRLKQKQQSGTQQHLVVSEKRRLAALIGKTQRARNQLINKMMPHVRYVVDNTVHHTIPANWKQLARAGEPYWIEANDESDVTPSTAVKTVLLSMYCVLCLNGSMTRVYIDLIITSSALLLLSSLTGKQCHVVGSFLYNFVRVI